MNESLAERRYRIVAALTEERVAVIRKHLAPERACILEIGALDWATFRRPDYDIYYADYASRLELSKKADKYPRFKFEGLVDVDYVINGMPYSEGIDKRFELIIANHVIEHIPDVISWLLDLGRLLTSEGILFLSVPDRRYTFDILRRESNFIDLIRPYVTRQKRPDFVNILDHLWHHKEVKAAEVWANKHLGALDRMRFGHHEAIENAKNAARQAYADVHCHVFTKSSFVSVMTELQKFGLVSFADIVVEDVIVGRNEFHVVLKGFDLGAFKSIDL